MMKVDDYLKKGRVYVWEETFALVKSKKSNPTAFVNIVDKNETTVIIDQSKCNDNAIDAIAIEKNWKMITFAMTLPLGLVGFIAKVSQALADENIPLFVISTYSTDHVLVRKKYLVKAIKTLENLGCVVEKK